MTINMKKKKRMIEDPAIEALKTMQDAVRSALINSEPGDELDTLIQTLQQNGQGQQVKDDILAALQQHYPGGIFKDDQLNLFGSAAMGMAFKDSYLDFYVELPKAAQSKSVNRQIKIVRGILERTRKFTRFESITKPRVPILKCTHIDTLTNCDFNCSNPFGSLNSPIITHLLNFDARIHKLAIIIKYWTKIHDCAGINRISNYAVVWMLIFYLQTLPEPIVPPIDEFQRNVPPSMVSNRNFAFDYAMPNRTENQSQWPELLLGFFTFYRDFDFDTQLICPLYGKTWPKADVQQEKVIELQRYYEILSIDCDEKPMRLDAVSLCIQDPFDIVRKIPGDIGNKKLKEIVWKISHAADVVEDELQKGDTKSLLLRIFDVVEFDQYAKQKELQQDLERIFQAQQLNLEKQRLMAEEKKALRPDDKNENRKKKEKSAKSSFDISSTSIFSQNTQNREMTLHIQQATNCLPYVSQCMLRKTGTNNVDVHTDNPSIRKMWAKEVIEMIVEILHNIFHLEVVAKTSDEFVKEIDLIAARNILLGRKRSRVLDAITWNREVLDASHNFDHQSQNVPLRISARITADIENFDNISVELNDQIKTKRKNFYGTFCSQFSGRIDYFLNIYFAHRHEIITHFNQAQPPTKKSRLEPA